MCRVVEDMRNQTLKEGMINVAKIMLEDGTITLEKIAEFFALKCKFSVNMIKKSFTKRHWQDSEKHTYFMWRKIGPV